ncbi:MAG: PadR family transcriptional regulator [Defluviitaleaceae bacterium]|nr:PadR family transcriptional regulator [Defluviitaleaceae bacterium]MCL2238454.1 PadR family transcriptional regulator [Defluviitaleaceae bacterium]
MSLKHGLLGMLSLEPMTGYDINKEFRETMQYIWQTKYSQIYNELDRMEQKGWLTSERIIQEEKPNKRIYAITENGKTELLDWLSKPEDDVKIALTQKNAFLLRVFLAWNTNKEAALKLLHSFREVCLARIAEQDDVRQAIARDESDYDRKVTLCWHLVTLHGDLILQSRLDWVEKAIEIINEEFE